MKSIILIGMPGCGKSTLGVILAKELGLDFVDTDIVIQQRTGELLQTTLEARGVTALLDEEENAHSRNAADGQRDNCIHGRGVQLCKKLMTHKKPSFRGVVYREV